MGPKSKNSNARNSYVTKLNFKEPKCKQQNVVKKESR